MSTTTYTAPACDAYYPSIPAFVGEGVEDAFARYHSITYCSDCHSRLDGLGCICEENDRCDSYAVDYEASSDDEAEYCQY